MFADDDLFAAARRAGLSGSAARLIDWQRLGLVQSGAPGRGRGRGRSARQWSAEQRSLFLVLLECRKRGAKIRELAELVVSRWVLAGPGIPTGQTRRALETWCWRERLQSRRVARQLARELTGELPVAIRDAVFADVTEALHSGRRCSRPLLDDVPAPRRRDFQPGLTHAEAREYLARERLLAELPTGEGRLVTDADLARAGDDALVRQWRERHPQVFEPAPGPPPFGTLVNLDAVVAGISRVSVVTEGELEKARAHVVAIDARKSAGACRALLTVLG